MAPIGAEQFDPGQGTAIDKPFIPKPVTPREQCKIDGGFWDEQTQSCVTIKPPKDIQDKSPISKRDPTVFTSSETGVESGVNIPGKGTFLGISATDVNQVVAGEQAQKQKFAQSALGQQEVRIAQAEQQRILQEQLSRAGIPLALQPTREASIDWEQALGAGLGSSASYAAGGAAIGLVTSGGTGSIPLGIAGGVGGFIQGILSNIKAQQSGEIGAANVELTNGRTAMRQYAMLASRDPASADYYMKGYQETLTRVWQARVQLKLETSGNLNKWSDDGRRDLAAFDSFLEPGGLADIYLLKLQASLDTGVPLSIVGEELV